MINHARSLLLNRAGPDGIVGELGDELIPPDYRSVELPTHLQTLRRLLFGSDPDLPGLNYRTRQYLSLLHATRLEEFVLDLDPRISYKLDTPDLFDASLFRPQVTQRTGPSSPLILDSDTGSADASGRLLRTWDIQVLDSSLVQVTLQQPLRQQVLAYTLTDGVSDLQPLAGSDIHFRFYAGHVGSRWRIQLYSRPRYDLGAIVASLETIGEPVLDALFHVGQPAGSMEPYKTFRNLWYDHFELAYRLGGILLALVYGTDELLG